MSINKLENIVLFALMLLIGGFLLQLGSVAKSALQPYGSADFSKTVIILFIIGIIWRVIIKKRNSDKRDESKVMARSGWNGILFTLFVLVCYAIFLKTLGYFTTGFLLVFIYMLFLYHGQGNALKKKGLLKVFLISLAIIGVIFIVFDLMFELYLPKGILI